MAFQSNAFQSDAFQIPAGVTTSAVTGSCAYTNNNDIPSIQGNVASPAGFLPGGGSGGYPAIVAFRRLRQKELLELERLRELEAEEKRIQQAIEQARTEKAKAKEQRREQRNAQEQENQKALVREIAAQIQTQMRNQERDDEQTIMAFLAEEDARMSALVKELFRKVMKS